MATIWIIFKRELASYFSTPIAYVFLVIFVALSGVSTFYLGSFFERSQADLRPFFQFHPWLYLFLIPALAMRLWAEERRSGTLELLLTLPVTMPQAVLGKFLAAWMFSAIALSLTIPLWVTVNYLGDPDNGVILASYVGSILMAGAFLSIGACMSAMTKNQVIAFVVTAVVCLGFVMSGYPLVLEFVSAWAPGYVVEAVSSFSFLSHFSAVSKGVIEFRDFVFFISLIAYWLFANAGVIELKKAE
ncbi:MAG TPA: ABC transporter permease subunit [Gammaproteobacteria bacterium]